MKRELKFRAWDTKNNEWFKNSLTFYGFSIFGECTMICQPSMERLQDMEITQFTGLKDEKGNDIYEVDIVRFRGMQGGSAIALVEFYEGRFIFLTDPKTMMYRDVMGWRDTEIIGNIYENKELLTETK